MKKLSQARIATLALLGVTVVWGSTFIVIKDSIVRQPEADFLATRFSIAALLLILARPKALKASIDSQIALALSTVHTIASSWGKREGKKMTEKPKIPYSNLEKTLLNTMLVFLFGYQI